MPVSHPIPFLSAGFRPMFLGAALWGAASMALWILYWTGFTGWSPSWDALDWHVHELLFGYGAAVLCGFLLTAIPNWTGRAPVSGLPLLMLFTLWLMGRAAVTWGAVQPLTTAVALAFPLLFTLVAAHEVIKDGNRRNLPIIVLCALYTLGNLLFILGANETSLIQSNTLLNDSGLGARIGLGVMILLISLIGGRIVPMFTRNWLKQHQIPGAPPAEFARPDAAILLLSATALLLWCAQPEQALTGIALILTGCAHIWRLSRWQGQRTLREPLLSGLHFGYGFVPLGFLLLGGANLTDAIDPLAGLHAWTAGAIGTMTLTVMSRASLGHSGRPLKSNRLEQVFLMAMVIAGLLRVLSALGVAPVPMLHSSACLWMLAFVLFALRFAPMMFSPRL